MTAKVHLVQLEHPCQTPQREFMRAFSEEIQLNGPGPAIPDEQGPPKAALALWQINPSGQRMPTADAHFQRAKSGYPRAKRCMDSTLLRHFAADHPIAFGQLEITTENTEDLPSGPICRRGFLGRSIFEPPMLTIAVDDDHVRN